MTDLKFIKLTDIEPIKNYRDIEPVSEKDPDVIELADSILKLGMLQPVLCRPKKGKAGKYELIFGHRRLIAIELAGKQEIPAHVMEVADGDVLELQVTENLQRKDVHPLDEAAAYQAYMDQKKVGTDELAHKFSKSLAYITQRLSFNGLIPEAKKDFKAGILLVGHAVQLARLQPADQKAVISRCKNQHHKEGSWYDTVDDMKEMIEDEVMHELTHASFDKKDPTLVKKAGTCTACQKRSGGGLLFPDIKEKDRCFDGACYKAKMLAHTLKQIDELVLAPNPMPVVAGWGTGGMDPVIKKKLADNKVKLMEELEDYREASKKEAGSTLALSVNGVSCGRIVGILLKSSQKAKEAKAAAKDSSEELTAEAIDGQIEGIKERARRNLELDAEKVHKRIAETAKGLKPFLEITEGFPSSKQETAYLFYLAFEKMDSGDQKKVAAALGIPVYKRHLNFFGDPKAVYDKLIDASHTVREFIIRACLRSQNMGVGTIPPGVDAYIVRKVAENYSGIPIEQYEREQKEAADKRTEREKKRIQELQDKKKALKPKASPKKAAPKKAAKKSGGAKLVVDDDPDILDEVDD